MVLDDHLIDKRVVRRHLERGRIDAAEYQGLLAALPDLTHNVWRADPGATPPQPQGQPAADAGRVVDQNSPARAFAP